MVVQYANVIIYTNTHTHTHFKILSKSPILTFSIFIDDGDHHPEQRQQHPPPPHVDHHQTMSTAPAATSVDDNDSHHWPPSLPYVDHYQMAIIATAATTTTISVDDDSGHHHLLHLPSTPTLTHTTHRPSLLAHVTEMLWSMVILALIAQGLAATVTRVLTVTNPLPLDGPPMPHVYVLLLLVQHCHSHLSP